MGHSGTLLWAEAAAWTGRYAAPTYAGAAAPGAPGPAVFSNKLVAITDNVAATTLPAGESFRTLRTARFAEVLRGVSLTPGSAEGREHTADAGHDDDDRR